MSSKFFRVIFIFNFKLYFCDPVAKTLKSESHTIDRIFPLEAAPQPAAKGLNPDFLGLGGSFFCLLHCLIPQLMTMGVVGIGAGAFLSGEGWTAIFWISCLVAVWQAGSKSVFAHIRWMLWLAFAVFTLAVVAEIAFNTAHWVSMAGSAVLIAAHLYNLKKQSEWKKILACKTLA